MSMSSANTWLWYLVVPLAMLRSSVAGFDADNYSTESCIHDHTEAAIHFDEQEMGEEAIAAFRAATRCTGTARNFANLAVAQTDSGQLQGALRSAIIALHLSGGMNHFAHDALRDAKEQLEDADKQVEELVAELGVDPANLLDMRTAGERFKIRDDPELEAYFDDQKFIFSNVKEEVVTPPTEIEVADRAAYFRLLASDEFRQKYWERYPVLIKANHALSHRDFLSLDTVMDAQAYKVETEKPTPNVNFLGGAFVRKNTIGYTKGNTVRRKELEDGLRRHQTLQFLGIQFWQPEVSELALNMSEALFLPGSVNLYVTPTGEKTSLAAHNDFQCSFMTQLEGQKRWRLWHKPALHLPISERFIKGRDSNEQITLEKLGEPYMDVVLKAGDILYVPRGCIHATSTADSSETSMHLTVGVEAMWDYSMCFTWNSFLGGDEFHENPFLMDSWKQAVNTRANYDMELRKSVGVDINRAVASVEVDPASGDAKLGSQDVSGLHSVVAEHSSWKDKARKLMHRVVDDLFDKTDFADKTKRHIRDVMLAYNRRLRKVVATREGVTQAEFRDPNFDFDPENVGAGAEEDADQQGDDPDDE
eukprot:g898.t1